MECKKYLLALLSLLMAAATHGQNMRVLDGTYGSIGEQKGDIFIQIEGTFVRGYVKFPESIAIKYVGKIGRREVDVKYRISCSSLRANKDASQIKFTGSASSKVDVAGLITEELSDGTLKKTTLSGIIFSPRLNFPSGWLLSDSSHFPESNLTVVRKQLKKSYRVGDIATRLDKNARVSLFAIGKDYKLRHVP